MRRRWSSWAAAAGPAATAGPRARRRAAGRGVPIERLVGTEPDVLAMSPGGRIIEARADKVWKVGRRPVFQVRLASGREIRATGRHRLYGPGGWVRVDELRVGDRLGLA